MLYDSSFLFGAVGNTTVIGRSGQTVQTQIRLLIEEQSDQGLHCLLTHLHVFDKKTLRFGLFV